MSSNLSTNLLISSKLSDFKASSTEFGERIKLTGKKKCIMFGIASIAIVVGLIMGSLWTTIVNKILENQLVLSPSSPIYPSWNKTEIPIYLKIYLFNWTNSEEFLKNNSKPYFEELGPYVFKEIDYKTNQVWNDNGTVTFTPKRLWYFDESLSSGFLNDTVTNVDPVAVSSAYKFNNNYTLKRLLSLFKQELTVSKSVGELLFDGYHDPVLHTANIFKMSGGFPSQFGWFSGRNGSETYDGTFTVLTGSKDISNKGKLEQWNYKNKSDIHSGTCGSVDGLSGDLFPPQFHHDSMSLFASDTCSLIDLKYNNMVDHDGVLGKRFVATAEMFDNGTKVPSRACYCDGIECQPSGVFNVSICKYGAPAFMSLPHFYLADESYLNSIDGLKPDKEKHEFSIAIQPDLGVPLQVRARLQFNLLLQPITGFRIFSNVPKIYMPMFWFSREADLTESHKDQIKSILLIPLIGHAILYGIASIGLLVFFIGICFIIYERRNSDYILNSILSTKYNGALDSK